MLNYLTLIFCCQLVGELFVTMTRIPIPGPVLGMAILFTGLVIKNDLPAELAGVSDALLRNLSLLFVPAGVGILLHVGLLGDDWLPISTALVISTVLTIGVTATVMAWLGKEAQEKETEI